MRTFASRLNRARLPFLRAKDGDQERPPLDRHKGRPGPKTAPLAITPRCKETLIVTMAGVTVRDYVESGQFARLSSAMLRYALHFDEVLLVTADRTDYTEQFAGLKVRHIRPAVSLPIGQTLRTALAVAFVPKAVRRTAGVLALDEQGALAGWLTARAGGARLTLSVGAPWSPPRSRSPLKGWRTWPVRHGLGMVQQVTMWQGSGSVLVPERAERHVLPVFIDADLFCPVATTDPSPPDSMLAFIGAGDSTAAAVLMGAAQRLLRHKQGVSIRAIVTPPGAGGELQAKALQAEAAERGSVVEFVPLPAPELLPDLLARPRLCISFGSVDTLPYVLRSMACGVPCVLVEGQETSTQRASSPDWRDFVLRAGGSDAALARGIQAVLREPALRSRLGREGRRYVIARHSLEAIQREEAALLRQPGQARAVESPVGQDEAFDAEAEAAKLAAVLEMMSVADEEAA